MFILLCIVCGCFHATSCRDEYLHQRQCGLQSQNLLSRPLQKKFKDARPRGKEKEREGGGQVG